MRVTVTLMDKCSVHMKNLGTIMFNMNGHTTIPKISKNLQSISSLILLNSSIKRAERDQSQLKWEE